METSTTESFFIPDFANSAINTITKDANEQFELELKENMLLHLVYSDELKQEVATKNNSGGFVNAQFFEDIDEA